MPSTPDQRGPLTGLSAGAAYSATMHAGACAQPSASFAALPAITADAGGGATGDVPLSVELW